MSEDMYGKDTGYLVPQPALRRTRVVEANLNHAVVLGDHARAGRITTWPLST